MEDMMANAMNSSETPNRIGFHYFQDTDHYTNHDLGVWLPELKRLSASWIVLKSEVSRAIPEQFISGLLRESITPIIHFSTMLQAAPSAEDIKSILQVYSKWGVKYIVLFDKPNDAQSWSSTSWSQQDLVERFIDKFLPLALECVRQDLTPVFPPLLPGGSYWDTSFFKSALQSLQRRGQKTILNKMAVAAYAFTFGHELTWGAGGPEKWTQVKPYITIAGSEDQKGFNNYQWMNSIAKSLGLNNLPFLLFGTGLKAPGINYSPEIHAEIVQMMLEKLNSSFPEEQVSESVLGCNFWLLSAEEGSSEYESAWIKPDGSVLPIVRVLSPQITTQNNPTESKNPGVGASEAAGNGEPAHPIEHYLLLPAYEWGVADWHLDVTRAFIRKHQPTIGFSFTDALLAKKVTVIGGDQSFPPEAINYLRSSGCVVDQITGDGTSIATQLAER
jgi:hypothetical protein